MSDHPTWCVKDYACTAYADPTPSLRPAHRGPQARVEVKGAAVVTTLIQEIGQPPRLAVTAAGWAQGRTVELGTAGVQQLIDNLTEQLAVAGQTEARR
jgi:hypothetical protein